MQLARRQTGCSSRVFAVSAKRYSAGPWFLLTPFPLCSQIVCNCQLQEYTTELVAYQIFHVKFLASGACGGVSGSRKDALWSGRYRVFASRSAVVMPPAHRMPGTLKCSR